MTRNRIARFLVSVLALCLALTSLTASAEITYPLENAEGKTLTLWRILDGSIGLAGYTSSNDTPGVIKWQEETGVKLDIKEFADDGGNATALILAIQADTLPDMILFDYTKYNGHIMGLVNDDLIVETTPEMFEEYAPDMWAYINAFPTYLDYMVQLDGGIYQFPPHLFEPNSIYRYWKGFIYREDILEANGLELPTTNAEFKALLTTLKENVEGIEIPWTFNNTEFQYVFNHGYITSEYGLVNCAEFQIDGVYHYGAYEPEYKDVMAYMNELYSEGLIAPDFTTMDEPTAQAMFLSGQSAVLFGNNSRLNTLLNGQPESMRIIGGPLLHPEGMEKAYYSYADPYITTGDGVFISADSENVELALQFLNYLYTEEGNLMRNFGIEGESYTMVDGVPTYTELVTNNPDGYSLDGVARSYGLINWPGIHSDEMNRQRHPEATQIDAYEMWSDSDYDKYALIYTGVLEEYLKEYTDLWVDIDTYIKECRAKFITGDMSVENDFDSYISTLQSMGMDRVIEIKQATLDAWLAR